MELCKEDLVSYIRQKLLNNEKTLEWITQLLLAVEYIHKQNIIHRDLKSKFGLI